MVNLAPELEMRLPQELLALLRAVGDLACSQGQSLYLVGGAVRDLLLGRPNLDLDLVVEGDAISLAKKLAEARGGKVVAHHRFGTAKFRHGALSLDIATARRESYPKPGALPVVQPGSIGDDLLRRDFSINAMAIHLDSACFGELLDPYGGRGDLAQGLIRVLHENSFSDDPTRILRALRYEQRLDFHLEQSTEEWLRRDAVVMDIVTGERLRHELELILSEEEPEKVLSRAYELSVLSKLHPALKGDGWVRERFEWARKASAKPTSAIYLALLAYRLSEEEAKSLIARLKIVGKAAQVMRHAIELRGSLPALAQPQIAPSAIYRLLEKHPLEAIFATAIAVDSPLVRERLELYLTELRYIKPILDGDDLKEMGVPPGRRLGNTLRAVHNAKLDGRVRTEGEERELVQNWLSQCK